MDIMYTDLAFTTSHPPDVPLRSRIVAVCGITDVDGVASPQLDGWFFTDFYLFHHLFHPIYTHTSSQVWLTCLEPKYLVDKYTEYAHGDPRKERRVVLERDLLRQIELAGNIRVVDRTILLERFIKTVEDEARYAKRDGDTLIILIFGHGNQDNHGVYIGGKHPTAESTIQKIRHLKNVLPKGVNVTLLLTSCYSGGWLIQPNIHHQKPMNVTGIAASGPGQETRSWSLSRSAGRACGSTTASAILNQVIKIEESDQTESDSARSHPTYIDLASSIYDMATSLDTFFADQNIHFSAQDDDWEAHWRKRTGPPLTRFKDRWETLRKVPPSGVGLQGAEGSISTRRVGSLKRDLDRLASDYFKAQPGRSSLASNVALHGAIYQISRGNPEFLNEKTLQSLLNKVIYRLNMMTDADEYVSAMGLEFPSCHGYSIESGYMSDPVKSAKCAKAWDHLKQVKLIPPPLPAVFPYFSKPQGFLAIVLAERCQSESEMKERVAEALAWKEIKANELLPHVRAYGIVNNHDIRNKLNACFTALRGVGHKLRVKALAITPSHKGYTDVPTEDIPTF